MNYQIEECHKEGICIPIKLFAFNAGVKVHYHKSRSLDALKVPLLLGWSRASSDIKVFSMRKGNHYRLLDRANIVDNINVVKQALNLQ